MIGGGAGACQVSGGGGRTARPQSLPKGGRFKDRPYTGGVAGLGGVGGDGGPLISIFSRGKKRFRRGPPRPAPALSQSPPEGERQKERRPRPHPWATTRVAPTWTVPCRRGGLRKGLLGGKRQAHPAWPSLRLSQRRPLRNFGPSKEQRPAGARAPDGARPLSNLPQRGRGKNRPLLPFPNHRRELCKGPQREGGLRVAPGGGAPLRCGGSLYLLE